MGVLISLVAVFGSLIAGVTLLRILISISFRQMFGAIWLAIVMFAIYCFAWPLVAGWQIGLLLVAGCLPIWAGLYLSRERRPAGALTRWEADHQTATEFWTSVPPGSTAISIASLSKTFKSEMGRGRTEQAKAIAKELSKSQPTTEAELELLVRVFEAVSDRVADELACRRYLIVDPQNTTAKIRVLYIWSKSAFDLATRKKQEVSTTRKDDLISLTRRDDLSRNSSLLLLKCLRNIHLRYSALKYAQKISKRYELDHEISIELVDILLLLRKFREARVEMSRLRQIVPDTAHWRVVEAEMAARFDGAAYLKPYVSSAQAALKSSDHSLRRRIVAVLVTAGERGEAERFLLTEAAQSSNPCPLLLRDLELAEEYGFSQAALLFAERVLQQDSNNDRAAMTKRRLSSFLGQAQHLPL